VTKRKVEGGKGPYGLNKQKMKRRLRTEKEAKKRDEQKVLTLASTLIAFAGANVEATGWAQAVPQPHPTWPLGQIKKCHRCSGQTQWEKEQTTHVGNNKQYQPLHYCVGVCSNRKCPSNTQQGRERKGFKWCLHCNKPLNLRSPHWCLKIAHDDAVEPAGGSSGDEGDSGERDDVGSTSTSTSTSASPLPPHDHHPQAKKKESMKRCRIRRGGGESGGANADPDGEYLPLGYGSKKRKNHWKAEAEFTDDDDALTASTTGQ
jgi:hypothetical protein